MIEDRGLFRIPYYPELEVVNEYAGDRSALILSILLYWHSKVSYQRFNARNHLNMLSRNLRVDVLEIKKALDHLVSLKLLNYEACKFTTNSENPLKKEKLDEFYALNFHNLYEFLKDHNLNIPIKVLRKASDDSFDIMAYISPSRLPTEQGLEGLIKGDKYNDTCFNIAKIIVGMCVLGDYVDFSYKALAPGWRILVEPRRKEDYEDSIDVYTEHAKAVSERWMREGERSIDLDLSDGAFFLPDGNYFGTEHHHIWHVKKTKEPKILAAALYLAAASIDDNVSFISDLSIFELDEAFILLYRLTGIKAQIKDAYFENLDLQGEDLKKSLEHYHALQDSLSQYEVLKWSI